MHDLLFNSQSELQSVATTSGAATLGLNPVDFSTCLTTGATLRKIRAEAGEGVTLGVSGTPTLVFGRMRPDLEVTILRRVTGAPSVAELEHTLDGLLKAHS